MADETAGRRAVAEKEPSDEISASSTEPLRWPDPSRPIISEQWGTSEPSQSQPVNRYPTTRPPGDDLYDKPFAEPLRRRIWPMITAGLVILVLALVIVWLLWWR